jgi:broad specificity phosphatase PhoE
MKVQERKKFDMSPIKLDKRYRTVLYVVRHGESIGNANREFLGHTDKDLSTLGYSQAVRTAEYLAYENIDAIYSSDLIRAHNTALPHANMRGLTVKDDKSLREIYAGEWEGMKVEDIIEKYPHEFLDVWRENFGVCTIPGGESVSLLGERIYNALERIADANKGKKILIACHAAAIRSFWGKITKTAPEDLANAYGFPTNASVTVVYYDGKKLIPGEYSHDDHLQNM